MTLFDSLLASVPRCLLPGCDNPRVQDGICTLHNRDVVESDWLEGVEIRPVRESPSPFFNRSEIPDPIGVES